MAYFIPRVLKYIALLLIFSLLLLFIQSAIANKEYQIGFFLILALILIAVTYLSSVSVPLKFFLPGILFLAAFVIAPILYTVTMSTFKYQTGNYISKEEAIDRIKLLAITPDEAQTTFDVVIGKSGSQFAILASDVISKKYFLSTPTTRTVLGIDQLTIDENGIAIKAPNFKPSTESESVSLDKDFSTIRFKFEGDYFIMLEGSSIGAVVRQSYEFIEENGKFENLLDGTFYEDNGKGNFVNSNNPDDVLQPGWRAPIWFWAGMFNTEFGAVNALFNSEIAWFQNPNFSRFAVILVNLWLGFPYFYLITSGAMQAIPGELSEAAQIDGATPRQVFSKITLPLLLKIVSPLLVASFAFNFNNFNLIYLLTGGGPRNDLDGEVAGATDILISYTYRIAFGTNVQDLGFASAISVIIFFIVATISLFGIRKSKVLDSFS